mgnify:CR=1 FL=1
MPAELDYGERGAGDKFRATQLLYSTSHWLK